MVGGCESNCGEVAQVRPRTARMFERSSLHNTVSTLRQAQDVAGSRQAGAHRGSRLFSGLRYPNETIFPRSLNCTHGRFLSTLK